MNSRLATAQFKAADLIQNKRVNRRRWIPGLRWFLTPIVGVVLIVTWVLVAESERYPAFILPHPVDVIERLQDLYERGILTKHITTTIREAITGLLIAVGLAIPLGYIVARNRWVSALLMPYLVAIRAIPVVAIAAIIIIWLGTGIESKVFVAAFITWFPMMESTVIGIQSVDPSLRDLMRSHQATWWQIFRKLEMPSALPNMMSGLKIASTLAVVGAAVGELVGSSQGLAYLILFGRGTSDAPLVFGAVLLLTSISLVFYGIVALAENYLLAWRRAG
jgi:NitT/TauT family transport system permease protein